MLLLLLASSALGGKESAAYELYFRDSSGNRLLWDNTNTPPLPKPHTHLLLFVHGHKLVGSEPHYEKAWVDSLDTQFLRSFAETLWENPWLRDNVQPFYMNFGDHARDIAVDATDIDDAITRILNHYHAAYETLDGSQPPRRQISVIAYSKGTISTRLYLKNMQAQLPSFHPVSEFVAVAPPNHGLTIKPLDAGNPLLALILGAFMDSQPGRQLSNGFRGGGTVPFGHNCARIPDDPDERGFMEILNGHLMAHTHADHFNPNTTYDTEAPGSRPNGDPTTNGTLYVTLYDAQGLDGVGGDTPIDDCTTNDVIPDPALYSPKQGRKLAINLAADAENIPIDNTPTTADLGITSVSGGLAVHVNFVHHPQVICHALTTALHRRARDASFTCSTTNDGIALVPVPPPQVVLVLDMSGSMLFPGCPTCPSKLELLQDAVELFINVWKQFDPDEDQIGVVYFRNTASPFTFASNGASLAPVCTAPQNCPNADDAINDVRNQQTTLSALTAMGSGLAAGIHTLQQPLSRNRHIILFTDGMQNVAPLVQWNGTQLQIGSGATPVARLDNYLGVRVHSIGVGADPAFVGMLDDIATETDGLLAVTTNPQQDLRQTFLERLVETLRGESPQLIGYRHGTLSPGAASEAFAVGRSAGRIVLKLSWKRGEPPLSFRVRKDGTDVTAQGVITTGQFYHLFTVKPGAVQPNGTWTLHIKGKQGQTYEAAALIDENELHYNLTIGSADHRVGDMLQLDADIRTKTTPLTGNVTVTAVVQAPQQSVATLLATRSDLGDPDYRPSEPRLTLHQQRVESLLLDPEALQAIGTVTTRIELREIKPGRYQAFFPATKAPGVYTVRFQLDGHDPKLGTIQRTEAVSTVVRFAAAVAEESKLQVALTEKGQFEHTYTLSLRPRDQYGNYLGPGRANAIQAKLSAGSVLTPIGDKGDGTYGITLLVPHGADPTLRLAIGGQEVFYGSLSKLF